VQLAYPPVDDQLAGLAELAAGALLGARLEDPAVAFYFVDESSTLGNG